MLIGYARVSTDDQNLDLQRDALHTAGCEKVYEDCISGANVARPGTGRGTGGGPQWRRAGGVAARPARLIPARIDRPGHKQLDGARIGLIEQHLTLALETGHQASEKPITEAIAASLLSKQIDDLEPTLTRHGYSARGLTEMLGNKPGKIKTLFKQTLEPDRVRELKDQMPAAGLPV